MWSRLISIWCAALIALLATGDVNAQCFASSGNPVGGSANLGIMDKNGLRIMTTYRYHLAAKYYRESERYYGRERTLSSANYNFQGLLIGYGVADKLSLEAEMGYYYNKTQYYLLSDNYLNGFGLSSALISAKYMFYQNSDAHFEVSGAGGLNIPFSDKRLSVNGTTLPIDLQPSTLSYGVTLQSYMIKENSFKALRLFWINRYDHNFKSPQGYVFGPIFSSALFLSRHFVLGQGKFKDVTLIVQARYQSKGQNINNDNIIKASGGRMIFAVPQVNVSINETWNVSFMYEVPIYQYYHETQLGANYALAVNLSRDFNLNKK